MLKNYLIIGLLLASSGNPYFTCNGPNASPNNTTSNSSGNANISPSTALPPESLVILESNLKPNSDSFGPLNIWSVRNNGADLKALSYQERYISTFPQLSPDKTKILFWSNRPLNNDTNPSPYNLWVMNVDGSNPQALTQNSTSESLNSLEVAQYSPDGRKIIFLSSRNLNGVNNALENPSLNLWIMNSDGSDLHPLTRFDVRTLLTQIKWSPDGNKISFLSNLNPDGSNSRLNNVQNLWSMQMDGSRLQALSRLQRASISFYDWSNDSSKFVVSSNVGSDGSDVLSPVNITNLWTFPADGSAWSALTRLTHGMHYRPLWSLDGKYILYISNRKLDGSDTSMNAKNLWAYKFEGDAHNPVTKLTLDSIEHYPYAWSEDSAKILFLSNRHYDKSDKLNLNGTSNLWMVNPDGNDLGTITGLSRTGQSVGNGSW